MESNTWLDGHVHWFDELSEEGVVKDHFGNSYFVHSWAIVGADFLRDKAKVKFQLTIDTTFVQVRTIMEVTNENQ